MSTQLKFRAECAYDVDELIRLSPKDLFSTIQRQQMTLDGYTLPDEEVAITLGSGYTMADVLNGMRDVVDGHVMVQTLMLADEYTGERDYERI